MAIVGTCASMIIGENFHRAVEVRSRKCPW
jgi:nitrogenase molybdenum-iron protein alpha/beta subunit